MRTSTLRTESPAYRKLCKIVGRNIRAKRESLGLMQTALGDAVGVSQARITAIETAKRSKDRNPTLSMAVLCDIAQVFNVPVDVLFRENAFGREQ